MSEHIIFNVFEKLRLLAPPPHNHHYSERDEIQMKRSTLHGLIIDWLELQLYEEDRF